jgi:hypothetical protein
VVYGLKLNYEVFLLGSKMTNDKKGLKGVNFPAFKANWSGFISQDFSKPNNEFRNEVFEMIKAARHPSWREFIGDVLLHLFENASAEEILELLRSEKYIDQRGYVEASKAMGIDAETAKSKYYQLEVK